MNRSLRAATMGALLLTSVTLTACSAGQVNQTSTKDRDKGGPAAEVGDLQLRQVQIANPCEAGDDEATAYEDGDDPELVLSIANTGRADDTLTAVEGDVFDGVFVGELPDETAPTLSATPTPPAPQTVPAPQSTPTGAPGTTGTPSVSGAPTATQEPAPAAPVTTAVPTPSSRLGVDVPAGSVTTIGLRQYEEGQPCEPEIDAGTTRLFLADLTTDEPVTASQTVAVTLTFANAGEVTVQALVAGPQGALPRGEAFDFHEEEGAEAGHEQDTEAE